ncbi:MAG: ParA family protein [Carboxylicivirga sp.]|jgi:cellulose biosynthesis protein BcsQ|nr:ParA family protein [Carboxylicivirga sp.]
MKNGTIVGFVNQKGGVGKTTLSISACTALAQNPFNYSCAYIDCDAQASALKQRTADLNEVVQLVAENQAEIHFHDENIEPSELQVEEYAAEISPSIREKLEAQENQGFPYPVFFSDFDKLPTTIVDLKKSGKYDFIFIDMPGQAQGDGIGTFLMMLDHAFVPVYSGDFDLSSTIDFIFNKLFVYQEFKVSQGHELNINIVFNKLKKTTRYKGAINSFKSTFKDDERVTVIDPENCLSDSVFYEDNMSTHVSMLDAPASDQSRKKARNQFKTFIDHLLNTIK